MGFEAPERQDRNDGPLNGAFGRPPCPFVLRHIRTELVDPISMSRGARERLARHKRRREVNGEMFDELIAKLQHSFSTRSEEGATAAEYGLLIFLIALAIMGGAAALGTSIGGLFSSVAGAL